MGTIIGSATLTLNGVSADFDAATGDLTGFNFTTTPNQWIVLNTPFGGFDQVWINSASVVPGPGFGTLASTPLGPGHWDVSVLPVVVNAVYTAKNSVTSASVGPIPLSYTNSTPLNATIDVVSGTFVLQGITLGMVSVQGEANPLVVGATITFSGVPEPGSASLLLLGGLGFALARMRR
ncbi:MAG TPA: PEP-CTERM sorting domain-containing protein [Myxococcota bacterium]|nr:PEP-CTERM sorting domain-containing protein [Myxococcota bacterium]